ncbi:aromatic ring-hydroxylating oxygenase subunit alpha [Mycolicibacter hiberniae]|uniref:(2Fe-2S)-binding protein n=1 Tax=Mycolicibacter hiberniae TaxID=29314 RepID=A0A7I7X7V6_9MYCO|nr:SRPBCC family protein [Mycolicibacter hiberniae]MCV7085039.1 Rieske 2Fe-2S domain-containing protein [Mycolicibacter hiberniae]ORV68673.1 (2Fe-2S)-binding protein [Mycolicibacter hiberniae]BBZ25325.1 (2Fe-2S)-binding protein [Mycolicibacter hiberniae]
MQSTKPGDWVETAPTLEDIDFAGYRMNIPTDRYICPEIAEREAEQIWKKVWRVVGRVSELPETGDWKEYRIRDQSYVIVRGKDERIRGFVNACRHRGNRLCEGAGNAKRGLLCQYHLWSYGLDGHLRGVLREKENTLSPLDKEGLSLLPVAVECLAGFIFLNPDPDAEPLSEFLGPEIAEMLQPYHLDEMVTVMDVKEDLECNWKVVMDAFEEGYHISGIHPQLLRVIMIDPYKSRYKLLDKHSISMAPFEVANADTYSAEEQVEGILELPETFPSVQASLPRFQELVDEYRDQGRELAFPEGVTARTLLQRATRETLRGMGLDVDGLTDAQMSDNHGWVLFPNFFMTIRAGEATVIMSEPHPSGDPNRCSWHIMSFMWLPEEHRGAFKAEPIVVDEPGSYKYFLALQQDYEQMPRQQIGLRNERLKHMSLVKEEIVIAHYHSVVDRYLAGAI